MAAGPQVGFNIGDTDFNWQNALTEGITTITNQTTGQTQTLDQLGSTFQLKKSSFGINVGAGVYLLKHFEVGFVYNIPLGNTADLDRYKTNAEGVLSVLADDISKMDVKANTWQVSAAFYF